MPEMSRRIDGKGLLRVGKPRGGCLQPCPELGHSADGFKWPACSKKSLVAFGGFELGSLIIASH
jgi:hypothetical protein